MKVLICLVATGEAVHAILEKGKPSALKNQNLQTCTVRLVAYTSSASPLLL